MSGAQPGVPCVTAVSTDFLLPELDENVSGGDVLRVLVRQGDVLAVDQPVLELETDKATIEVPSSVQGLITEVRVRDGQKLKVGDVVLKVEGAQVQVAAPRMAPASASRPQLDEDVPAPEGADLHDDVAALPEPTSETPPVAGPVEFSLPSLGENVVGGDVLHMLVRVGDVVRIDQPVLELETDKATIEVPSSVAGR